VDKGPWKLCARSDGKLCVASDDFEHDVQLIISGDFADEFQRADYAAWLAKTLNKGADQPDAARSLPEFWQLAKLNDGRAVVYVTEEQWDVLRQCWRAPDQQSAKGQD
jgi:hypothetical protein